MAICLTVFSPSRPPYPGQWRSRTTRRASRWRSPRGPTPHPTPSPPRRGSTWSRCTAPRRTKASSPARCARIHPKNNHITCASTCTAKWSKACTKPVHCQRVSLGLQHWRARMYLCNCTFVFVQLCKCIYVIRWPLCVHMCVLQTHFYAHFAPACAHTVQAVPDPSAKNPKNLPVRVVKILT